MTNLVPFSFESNQIRTVVDPNGDVLFVAKDVATALGYENTTQAVRIHCKKAKSLIDIGGYPVAPAQDQALTLDPQTKLIPESDVYRLTMKSTLDSAERFQDWVTEEVLPQIRKTGSYHTTSSGWIQPQIDANALFHSNLSVAKLIFAGNQALLSANVATRKFTGTDVLSNLGATHLLSPETSQLLTATDLALRLDIGKREANPLLTLIGWQTAHRDHKDRMYYEMTEEGLKYGTYLDTGKKHSDGSPVKQIKWKSEALQFLKEKLSA